MLPITFHHVHTPGRLIEDRNEFRHYHSLEWKHHFDSNFISFKQMPTTDYFQKIESRLRDFHRARGQNHLKFHFPPNTELPQALNQYLHSSLYDVSVMELYAIQPAEFPRQALPEGCSIQRVDVESLPAFLAMQLEQDLPFGEAYAAQKQQMLEQQFYDASFIQLIAYYHGRPAGFVELIASGHAVEMDNLFVHDDLQRKGIGHALQQFTMNLFPDKAVFLVADQEDTPRDMYRKQNYERLGFQYTAIFQ
ncbi:hypothetical protein CHL76_07350 [Marinococcus halophilus]|uniref:N-acetyltransferase n=1 Tax=Marinococcus halophilus TaxID=1371 RepID=A0A510Y7H8_MARHA|nr:GNAT family N-acetyltransferase [Marinococcus halophilus]OZT80338.1 hypothetical protein CHL76_07350 [Marinococcus halophilus]GEK58397.1 N-acetyltransferase [Marinococcus halophilus]